jgi:lipopolysaccharide export system permease protein
MTLEALTRGVQEMQLTQRRKQTEAAQEAAMLLMTGDFPNLTGEQLGVLQGEQRRARNQELRFRTELHSRFSMAASCLFFVFVGGPFAMLQARRQFITTFVMCFLPILLIYYPVMFLMLNLSKNASLNPLWAMWVPNLILGFVGASVLSRVVRH